jgi:hypothetical protein
MVKYLIIGLIFPFISINAQVDRIDHIYVKSSKAEELFDFFKNEIKLPIAWDYEDWGSFSSGGLFFGNANVEIIDSDTMKWAEFKGIALEPNNSASRICNDLNNLNICNNGVDRFYDPRKNKDVKNILWSTIDLVDLLPPNIHFFICDYKGKEQIHTRTKRLQRLLLKNQKTGLGIVGIAEIEIGVLNPESTQVKLKQLPGIRVNGKHRFSFKRGMEIRTVQSTTEGITQIKVLVKSKEKAQQFLRTKNCLEKNRPDNRVFIDPRIIDNLSIEFIEE